MIGCDPNFGDWGNNHAFKDYTFSATGTGQKNILIVTGDILLRIFGVCTTTVVTVGAVGTCSLGIAANVTFILPVTSGDALASREIWHDSSPDSQIENLSVVRSVVITNSQNVTLDLLVAAFTSGVLRFYYTWKPLSELANVVNA